MTSVRRFDHVGITVADLDAAFAASAAGLGTRAIAMSSGTSPRQRAASSSLPMPSFWMRSWSITMPWSSASGRGGQPGT